MSSNLKVNTIQPSSGDTVSIAGIASITSSVSIASSCTATTFYGDGSNLTGVSGLSVGNQADNRLITCTGTTDTLYGESNLTFASNVLTLSGTFNVSGEVQIAENIVHTGDGNTAIGFPANDTIRCITAGVERLRIDSSGRVLIGTTTEGESTADDLTIATSGTTGMTIRSGTSGEGNIFFSDGTSGADEYAGTIQYSHASNYMLFFANAAERFRITSDGKVVAGSSGAGYPSRLQSHGAGNLLDLNSTSGAAVIRFYESGSGRFDLRTNNGSSGLNFYDSLNGVERLRIDSNGDLGLGIAAVPQDSGARTLHIHDTTTGSGARAAIRLTHGSTGSAASNGAFIGMDNNPDFYLYNQEDGNLRFGIDGSESMRSTKNGNGTKALYINQTSEVSGANSHLVVNNSVAVVTGSTFRSMYMSGNGQVYWWNGTNQPYISTGGIFTNASDISLKKDITDLTYGIDVLKNLKPRKYKMKADDKEQIGFIAQEVETAVPEVVDTSETPNGDEHKGLAYGNLTAVLTKALQEAVTKIETLEAKVAALESSYHK